MEKRYRISILWAIFWVLLAIVADLLSLIPFVGAITGPLFWVCASAYLWKVGCGIVNGKRLATSIISMVGEVIPAIQALPLATVGMIVVIMFVYFEDKTGINLPKKGAVPMNTRAHLNSGGVRLPPTQTGNTISRPANVDGVRTPGGGLVSTLK